MPSTPPGFVPAGRPAPFHARLFIYGEPKTGKSVFCGTWPAPIFLHPTMESGYDTFRIGEGGVHIFPFASLGADHPKWVRGLGGQKFSDDLRSWLEWLAREIAGGKCPYKTVVLGGFNVMQQIVEAEGEKVHKNNNNKYAKWDYVASWMRELLQTIAALPVHVIFECNAKVQQRGPEGQAVKLIPGLHGQGYDAVLAAVNAILFQESLYGGIYQTWLTPPPKAIANVRIRQMQNFDPQTGTPLPVFNCSYDYFAGKLGLPPIWEADPDHPRCKPDVWPWPHMAARGQQQPPQGTTAVKGT